MTQSLRREKERAVRLYSTILQTITVGELLGGVAFNKNEHAKLLRHYRVEIFEEILAEEFLKFLYISRCYVSLVSLHSMYTGWSI